MGVEARITLEAPDRRIADAAASAAYGRLRALDAVMSDWRDDSELMRLCAAPARAPQSVSHDLVDVLERAEHYSRMSNGAFDATVGPLVQLWREARRSARLPESDAIADARRRTGWHFVSVDRAASTVTLERPGMQLDLGGIGKGYAIDAALVTLRDHGVGSALVDLGGDLGASSPPPGRAAWRVQARTDQAKSRPIAIALTDAGLATSGDAAQFIEINGMRYSHIVDPATGIGLTNRTSVTVLAPDATCADALASALSVLGAERGLALAESHDGVEAFFETATPAGLVRTATRGFRYDGPRCPATWGW